MAGIGVWIYLREHELKTSVAADDGDPRPYFREIYISPQIKMCQTVVAWGILAAQFMLVQALILWADDKWVLNEKMKLTYEEAQTYKESVDWLDFTR